MSHARIVRNALHALRRWGSTSTTASRPPTGQLDSKTSAAIVGLLHRLVADGELTAIVATHDVDVIADADDRLELSDGQLVTS